LPVSVNLDRSGVEPAQSLRGRQVVADQQWQTVQEEDRQNQQLLNLSHQILELTKAVHAYAAARSKDART
jgi:hypothetical protein